MPARLSSDPSIPRASQNSHTQETNTKTKKKCECVNAVARTLAVSVMARGSSTACVTDFMQPMGNDTHSREEAHDPNVACQGGETRNSEEITHDENSKKTVTLCKYDYQHHY